MRRIGTILVAAAAAVAFAGPTTAYADDCPLAAVCTGAQCDPEHQHCICLEEILFGEPGGMFCFL